MNVVKQKRKRKKKNGIILKRGKYVWRDNKKMRMDRSRVKIKLFKYIPPNRGTVFVKRTYYLLAFRLNIFRFFQHWQKERVRSFRIALLEILLLWSAISAIVSVNLYQHSSINAPVYIHVYTGVNITGEDSRFAFNWTAKLKVSQEKLCFVYMRNYLFP